MKKRDIEWAIYNEKNKNKKKKERKKWKPKQKQKATGQWKWRKTKKQKEKKKGRETWTLLNTAYREKKERTDIFSKIDSTSLHRLKKRRKENWTFLNCDCNIVLTCCKVKLFEFVWVKGDIRIFFSCSYYEIWRKPLTEDFRLGLLIFVIILILKFLF